MGGQAEPIRIGDVELLIETEPVSGSQPVSRAGGAARRVVDAFDEVEAAIEAVAGRVAQLARNVATPTSGPSELRVEFGLKVSASGNVIVAGASGEAALKVTISYPGTGTAPTTPITPATPAS